MPLAPDLWLQPGLAPAERWWLRPAPPVAQQQPVHHHPPVMHRVPRVLGPLVEDALLAGRVFAAPVAVVQLLPSFADEQRPLGAFLLRLAVVAVGHPRAQLALVGPGRARAVDALLPHLLRLQLTVLLPLLLARGPPLRAQLFVPCPPPLLARSRVAWPPLAPLVVPLVHRPGPLLPHRRLQHVDPVGRVLEDQLHRAVALAPPLQQRASLASVLPQEQHLPPPHRPPVGVLGPLFVEPPPRQTAGRPELGVPPEGRPFLEPPLRKAVHLPHSLPEHHLPQQVAESSSPQLQAPVAGEEVHSKFTGTVPPQAREQVVAVPPKDPSLQRWWPAAHLAPLRVLVVIGAFVVLLRLQSVVLLLLTEFATVSRRRSFARSSAVGRARSSVRPRGAGRCPAAAAPPSSPTSSAATTRGAPSGTSGPRDGLGGPSRTRAGSWAARGGARSSAATRAARSTKGAARARTSSGGASAPGGHGGASAGFGSRGSTLASATASPWPCGATRPTPGARRAPSSGARASTVGA